WGKPRLMRKSAFRCALPHLARAQDLREKALCLLLQSDDVRPDLLKSPQRLRLVEKAGEADLVTGLDALRVVPGIGSVGQHLTTDERLDAARFQQRHLLGVAQVAVGL